MSSYAPLFIEYPKPGRGSIAMLLEDFPKIGYQSKVRRSLERQLKDREELWFSAEKMELWKNENVGNTAKEVARIIAAECSWPNTLFLPKDLMYLLLWVPRGDMEAVDVFCSILKRFDLTPDALHIDESTTFGDVVEVINKRHEIFGVLLSEQ